MYFVKKNNENNYMDEISNFFNDGFKWNNKNIKSDIIENEKDYSIIMDVPGVDKKDVSVNVENEYLTVSVKREASNEDKNKKYIKHERMSESYERSFYVGNISNESIKAKMDNGVLTISVPKEEKPQENKNYIPIE